jgi:imidazolonepropionase-like amidohydrolase
MWEDSVGDEGADGNEDTDPVTPQLRAIDGIYFMDKCFTEAREAGVTTCVTGPGSANVIGGQFVALKTDNRNIDKMVLREPVAMKMAFGQNPKLVYSEKRQTPATRMASVALIREICHKSKEYEELLDENIKDPEENDKPDYDIKYDAMQNVLKGKLPVKAHAHRADDILTAIRLSKEFGFKLTIEHCTEGHLIADLLAREKVGCISGPFITDRSKIELRNLSPKTPGILASKGIKVAIMTDHPCTPVQYLSLCAAIAVKNGMEEEEALKAITINAAELTGISDRVGSIETGKDGDLVIVKGDILDIRSKILYTIINGEVVYEGI